MEIRPVTDNAPLEARADVLTYTTDPLADDVEAIGPVEADLYLASSAGFFDVFARVCDVHPDGRSFNVCDALVRVTPDDFEHADDGSVRVRFPLWPTAHRFRAGHSIRLQVSSGAHPRYARNPGTGEDPATATRLVAADQEVLHDAAHPSAITLAVVEGAPPAPAPAAVALRVPAAATQLAPLEPELDTDARFERRLFVREILIILVVAAAVVAWSTLR
jgi:putative CocE/NonD family hydrolase